MAQTTVETIDVPNLAHQINQALASPPSDGQESPAAAQLSKPDRWQQIRSDLLDFRSLQHDWDGLGARAPAAEVVESALQFVELGCQGGMEPPSRVVAGLDGDVIFEWQRKGLYMEVEVGKPHHGEFMRMMLNDEGAHPAEHRLVVY